MSFRVKTLPEVYEDVGYALVYYSKVNKKLPLQFLERLDDIQAILAENPFFEIKYKNVRTLSLKQFPYLIHFIVDEISREVIILAVAYAKEKPVQYHTRLSE